MPDRHHVAHVLGDRQVLRREGVGLLFDAGRQDRHGLGAGLHVLLHHLDQARGLARHQLAVRLDLPEHAFGERTIAFVEVLEGGGDVVLDLLELAADALHPVQGGGVGDLADRRRRGFHRGAGGAAALGEVGQRIFEPGRAQRERLEPFVAGVQEALDGLVAGEQRDDALLLRARVGAPGTPDLAGDLAHQGGRLLLDGQEAVGQAFVHGAFDRRGDAHLTGGHAWFGLRLLESTQQSPGCPGVLRGSGGAVLIHDVARDLGPPRGASRGA